MTDDARRIAADYLAALTDREARDFVAEARSEHAEMRAFAAALFHKDDDRSPWNPPPTATTDQPKGDPHQ